MRSTLCLALILAAVVLVPVRALGAEPLSPMVVQGLEQLSRAKATYTPTVSVWPTASAITYGRTLTNSALSGGSAAVDGSFAWTTGSTVPSAGTASQAVTFTPADTTNYASVSGSVSVTVNPLPAVLMGSRDYDGTVAAAAAILTVSNAVAARFPGRL